METTNQKGGKVRYTVRMHSDTYQLLKVIAEKENRSVSKEMEHVITWYAKMFHKQSIERARDGRTEAGV
jgi:hypothetical protein